MCWGGIGSRSSSSRPRNGAALRAAGIAFRSPQRLEFRSPQRLEFRSPQRLEFRSPQRTGFRSPQRTAFYPPIYSTCTYVPSLTL